MFIYRSTISFIVFILSSIFYDLLHPRPTFVWSSFSSERVSCRFFRCVRISAFAPKIDRCCSAVNYLADPPRLYLHFPADQRPNASIAEHRRRNLIVFAEILEVGQIIVDGIDRRGRVVLPIPAHQQRFGKLRITSRVGRYIGG